MQTLPNFMGTLVGCRVRRVRCAQIHGFPRAESALPYNHQSTNSVQTEKFSQTTDLLFIIDEPIIYLTELND